MPIPFIRLLVKIFFIPKKNTLLLFMTTLVTISIIIATTVCNITITIQNSVHHLLKNQLRKSLADVIITHNGQFFYKKHITYIIKEPKITAWAPASWRYVLISKKQSNNQQFGMIKFVNPKKEKNFLLQNPIYPNQPNSNHLSNGVVIGKGLQNDLNITVGDFITITFLQEHKKRGRIFFKPAHYYLQVTGIIITGIPDIDSTIILCSYDIGNKFIQNLYWDEIAIRFLENDIFLHEGLTNCIQKHFPELKICLLKNLFPSFFASLTLEQYVTKLYLLFLFFFVFIAITALFFAQGIYNQKKIIILHFLGMNTQQIYLYTYSLILLQIFFASLIGIFISYFIMYFISRNTPEEVQQAYDLTHLQIEISIIIILKIIMIIMIITITAGIFTFLYLSRYSTLQTLKNESL